MLDARLALGVPAVAVREDSLVDLREDAIRDDLSVKSEARDFKNTVCGTTPSFGSSTSPTVLMFLSVSGSRLNRDAKLMVYQTRSNTKDPEDQPGHCNCQSQDVVPYGQKLTLIARCHAEVLQFRKLCLVPEIAFSQGTSHLQYDVLLGFVSHDCVAGFPN
jgi:hypothetical protein